MKKQRPKKESWHWTIFVEACGGSFCCACGDPCDKLEKGHVIPFNLDTEGGESPDNWIPVCNTCNNRHKKTSPPDHRPEDYLERFYLLCGERLRPKISCITSDGSRYLDSAYDGVENKSLISWGSPKNGVLKRLLSRSSSTFTQLEAIAEVDRLLAASRRQQPPPSLPTVAAKLQLIVAAKQHSRRFRIAVDGFLYECCWVIPGGGDIPDRATHGDGCWHQFVANFDLFYAKGVEIQKRIDRDNQLRAESQRVDPAARRRYRWDDYLKAGKCTDWIGITDEDRAFIAAVAKETEQRDVTDAELERATGICRREFLAKREVVAARIALFQQMIALKNLEDAFGRYMNDCQTALNKAGLVKHLVSLYDDLTTFYNRSLVYELGPPLSDEEFNKLFDG